MASEDRSARIIRLLQTANDGLPEPRRREVPTTAGFVHADAMVSCPDCLANDRVMRGCETCKGRGVVLERRERDPMALDKVQPYGLSPDRHERSRARDAELSRLAAQTERPKQSEADLLASVPPEPWEIERRRMYRAYDYQALNQALEQLRNVDEAAYHILHGVYVYGWSEPSTSMDALVLTGLAFLDSRMPDPIRAPGHEHPAKAKSEARRCRAA